MDRLLKQRGMSKGSVAERMVGLFMDPANLFADSDEGRTALIASWIC